MPDTPKALTIVQGVAALLTHATVANGYFTDLGEEQYIGRDFADDELDDQKLPMHTIVHPDGSSETNISTDPVSDRPQNELALSIVAVDKCDPNDPLVKGHQLVADIKRAIWRKPARGKPAPATQPAEFTSSGVQPRAPGSNLVVAQVDLTVSYTDHLDNP